MPVITESWASFGSSRKQRYSSVPFPLGALGVYAVGIRSSRKRSLVRSATGFAAVVVALPLLVAEDAAAAGVWWLPSR